MPAPSRRSQRLALAVKGSAVRFCQTSSIQGVSRLAKTDKPLLTVVWLVFVLVMFAFVVAAVSNLVQRYLRYETTIISTIHGNALTEFPSTTLCLPHPFPDRAQELWMGNMSKYSPKRMHDWLRGQVDELIEAAELQKAMFVTTFDIRRMYYQSLDPDMALLFGFQVDEAIMAVMTVGGRDTCIGRICAYSIVRWSHPDYFNCFTLDIRGPEGIDSLTVIINIGEQPDHSGPQKAFAYDAFEHAWGVIAVLHEFGQYPDINRHSVYLQNGKLNEIKFESVRHEVTPTPVKPCLDEAEASRRRLRDMRWIYNYSHEKCAEELAARSIVSQCRCLPAWLIRHKEPSDSGGELPYCGDLRQGVSRLFHRLECIKRVVNRKEADTTTAAGLCPERCKRIDYETRVSQADWMVSQWQILRMVQQDALWKQVQDRLYEGGTDRDVMANSSLMRQLRRYYTSPSESNLTDDIVDVQDTESELGRWVQLSGELQNHGGHFVILRVKRASGDTTENRSEMLALDFYSLVCEIGGVCGLTLGLSCAFVVELFECLYVGATTSSTATTRRRVLTDRSRRTRHRRSMIGMSTNSV